MVTGWSFAGRLDPFGEYSVDAIGVGQPSRVQWSSRARSPSPWLGSSRHGGDLASLMEARAESQVLPALLCPFLLPGAQRDLREAREARRGRTARTAWCGCECTLLLHPYLTSPLSQPNRGSGFPCCSAAGLIQAGNLVLTEVAVVPNRGPWPSSQTLPAPGLDRPSFQ